MNATQYSRPTPSIFLSYFVFYYSAMKRVKFTTCIFIPRGNFSFCYSNFVWKLRKRQTNLEHHTIFKTLYDSSIFCIPFVSCNLATGDQFRWRRKRMGSSSSSRTLQYAECQSEMSKRPKQYFIYTYFFPLYIYTFSLSQTV